MVHGLEEQSDSAWKKREMTENIFRKFLAEGLKIDHPNDYSIVDLHRLPQYPLFKNNVKLNRPIIFKLSNNYGKQLIMSRLKLLKDYNTIRKNANPTASKIFISDHLPRHYVSKRNVFSRCTRKQDLKGKKPYGLSKMENIVSTWTVKD